MTPVQRKSLQIEDDLCNKPNDQSYVVSSRASIESYHYRACISLQGLEKTMAKFTVTCLTVLALVSTSLIFLVCHISRLPGAKLQLTGVIREPHQQASYENNRHLQLLLDDCAGHHLCHCSPAAAKLRPGKYIQRLTSCPWAPQAYPAF